MITIDNSISNNQPELSSSISHSCHFGDVWSRRAPGAGFGMSGGSQTLPWHSEGGMDRRESWQTKKSCVFLGQKSMRQWISAKYVTLSCHDFCPRRSNTMCDMVNSNLRLFWNSWPNDTKRTWQDIGWLYLASSIQRTLPEIGITVI